MVLTIPTPVAEVCDRYTIAQLKMERLPASEDPDSFAKQVGFYAGGIDWSNTTLTSLVVELYNINGKMWNAEFAIRQGQDEGLGLDEIGKRALLIRDLNKERIGIKNAICDLVGDGFKDCKMNSTTYAANSSKD